MVKITQVYLIKHLNLMRYTNESDKDVLARLSHLRLNRKYVDCVEKLPDCINVRVIYLQSNLLNTIPNFGSFEKVTHLYLQRNKISKLSNLAGLVSLRKLYLGYNNISVVEGLESLKSLRELHVEHQNLPSGESVLFYPRSITVLAETLEVLNISGCGICSLSPFAGMIYLKEILAQENVIADLQNLKDVLPTLPNLFRITLNGNQVTRHRDFRDTVVHNARNLKFIDNDEIKPEMRKFIDGWRIAQSMKKPLVDEKTDRRQKETKAVHFLQFRPAEIDVEPAATSLAYPPWKIRENIKSAHRRHPTMHSEYQT